MRRSIMSVLMVGSLLLGACGDDDDGGSGDGGGATKEDGGGDPTEMVPISTLGLDLPFDVPWDIPVPADSTVAFAEEIGEQNQVGLNSFADPEAIEAEWDTWFAANFENVNVDESFGSWQGVELTDTGSRGISAAVSTCSDCPDYETRATISVFEV